MIVGIHGIAQQQRGRRQLAERWRPALLDGIELALGRRCDVELDLAYFGHLFLRRPDDAQKGGTTADLLTDLDAAEIAFLSDAAADLVPSADLRVSATKGPPGIPGPVADLLAALDAKFGAAAGALLFGELRQVHRYLRDPELKATVDDIVATAVTGDTRVIVGHSLGSVVAYEFVRRHPQRRVELLLTLGSPLSLRLVRSLLPAQHLIGHVPANVISWVNVRDPRDPVALGGDLGSHWRGVVDCHVDNGWDDPHHVCRYLSKRETGQPVAALVTEGEPR